MPTIPVRVGNNTMYVTGEDFINGFQAGHLAYMRERNKHNAEKDLTHKMLEALERMEQTEKYSVGYVRGWIISFALRGEVPQ